MGTNGTADRQIVGRAFINLPEGIRVSTSDRLQVEKLLRGLQEKGFEVHTGSKWRGPTPAPALLVERLDDTVILSLPDLRTAPEAIEQLQ